MHHRATGPVSLRRALAALSLGAAALAAGAEPVAKGAPVPAELVLGVLPNVSTALLAAQYEPLKRYLERHGGTPVRIVLPASFKAFFDATLRGDFDLAVAAPHFARVAQLDANLQPLVMYEPRISVEFVTLADTPLAGPRDLRGKTLAFANPTSLVALYGQQWLRSVGLEPGRDVELRNTRTDMGVGRMLLSGDVAAAIMSGSEMRALPAEEAARLKTVVAFARIPNFIVLGHPRLGPERLASLKAQLLAFGADKDQGAAFLKATGVSALVEADEATLRELDPYTAATRRAMGVGP